MPICTHKNVASGANNPLEIYLQQPVDSMATVYALLFSFALFAYSATAQKDVCGRPCKTDVQCPDDRGVCTYCTRGVCSEPRRSCGGPAKSNTSKSQLLVIGDRCSCCFACAQFSVEHTLFFIQFQNICVL